MIVRLLFEGMNPEPWRSPRLGTKMIGRKKVPVAFKDENLRSYQEAIKEAASELLNSNGVEMPMFAKGTELELDIAFWRQTDTYEGESRRNARNRADVTNMQKAVEDALQGIVYANDRYNVVVRSTLVAVGPDVHPRVLLDCKEADLSLPALIDQTIEPFKSRAESDGAGLWIERVVTNRTDLN